MDKINVFFEDLFTIWTKLMVEFWCIIRSNQKRFVALHSRWSGEELCWGATPQGIIDRVLYRRMVCRFYCDSPSPSGNSRDTSKNPTTSLSRRSLVMPLWLLSILFRLEKCPSIRFVVFGMPSSGIFVRRSHDHTSKLCRCHSKSIFTSVY